MNDQQPSGTAVGRSAPLFEWITAHIRWITIGIVVVTLVAALVATGRSEDDPNFDPSGEIYDTLDLVDERFVSSSPIEGAFFVVEARNGGDALTRDVLLEFKANSDSLRANAELSADLAVQFRSELGEEVDGVRRVMPQQMIGPRPRLALRVRVRAAEEERLHIHLLNPKLAGRNALMDPLV